MGNDVKFIRRGGRIIPIKAKKAGKAISKDIAKQLKKRQRIHKTDFARGLGVAALGTLFFKRKGFRKVLGYGSAAAGAVSIAKTYKNEKTGKDFAKQSLGGIALKMAGSFAGVAGGYGALKGLNKLRKFRR